MVRWSERPQRIILAVRRAASISSDHPGRYGGWRDKTHARPAGCRRVQSSKPLFLTSRDPNQDLPHRHGEISWGGWLARKLQPSAMGVYFLPIRPRV